MEQPTARASCVRPQLITVRQSIGAKGPVAADFMVAAINGDSRQPHQGPHTALIVREATAVHPPEQQASGKGQSARRM